MTVWQALLFGIVQGLTEFLPISSSGHLALFEAWLAIKEPTLFFNVFLHAASLIAIIIFFWPQILKLKLKDYWLLLLASIPVGIVGWLLKDSFEFIATNISLVGLMLVVTGGINLLSQRKLDQGEQGSDITKKKAVIIGLFQSLAILPGISRSGTTLLGGLSQKLSREQAFTFTFLLGIPAILGANAVQIISLLSEHQAAPSWLILLAGGIGALGVSLVSLSILKKVVTQAKLKIFGFYCLVIGGIVILSQLV